MVKNQAVYLALGVAPDGTRDVLGLWIEQTEGAKFWMKVMNELRNRGVPHAPNRSSGRAGCNLQLSTFNLQLSLPPWFQHFSFSAFQLLSPAPL